MDFSPESMRAEFRKLTKQADAIKAKADPIRQKRDDLIASTRDKELDLNAKLNDALKGLAEIENKRGMIVRALGGKTGKD